MNVLPFSQIGGLRAPGGGTDSRKVQVGSPGSNQMTLYLYNFSQKGDLFYIFEHTCAYARWAPMHSFLSVRLFVRHWTIIHWSKIQTRK